MFSQRPAKTLTFLIPSQKDQQLKLGDQVRLIFVLDTVLENGCRAERMWVELH